MIGPTVLRALASLLKESSVVRSAGASSLADAGPALSPDSSFTIGEVSGVSRVSAVGWGCGPLLVDGESAVGAGPRVSP